MQLHTGLSETLAIGGVKALRAKIVKQAANPHTSLRRTAQGIEQHCAAGTAFHQVEFEVDLLLRCVDAQQHLPEKLRPVDQQ
jgi:hypothetical protein